MSKKLKEIDNFPSKILSEINRSSSILRDIFDDSFSGIHVDDENLKIEIEDYLNTIDPKKNFYS